MNFFDHPPSKQWATLKFKGQPFAEVWLKPDGDPCALTFRLTPDSYDIPNIGPLLTPFNLISAVGIAPDKLESCRFEGSASDDDDGPPDLQHPLPLPSPDVAYLYLHLKVKPSQIETAGDEPESQSAIEDISESKWQDLEARWNAVLVLEASLDTLRISMEGVRGEMESASRRSLSAEEKIHALNSDVAQWNKAKTRLVYAIPKARDFIHRSTWVAGAPERKKLEELHKNHIQPRIPFPGADQILAQLEFLLKDRQTLSSHGTSTYQECKGILAEVQNALQTMQRGASANAVKKRGSANKW